MIIEIKDIVKVILFAISVNLIMYAQLAIYLKYKRHEATIRTAIIINQEATTERSRDTTSYKEQPIND